MVGVCVCVDPWPEAAVTAVPGMTGMILKFVYDVLSDGSAKICYL